MNPKTRNSGQWTESRFNSFVMSALRAGYRRWPPKFEILKAAFVGVQENVLTKRQAKHYLCAECKKPHASTSVQVDHIVPIGFEKSWDETVEGLFCEKDNLQVLCKDCHSIKTKKERQEYKNGSK